VQSGNPGSVRAGAPLQHHRAFVEVERGGNAELMRILIFARCACDQEFGASFNLFRTEPEKGDRFWMGFSASYGARECPALVATLRGCRAAVGKPLSLEGAIRELGGAA
jgi:hypothetical protein